MLRAIYPGSFDPVTYGHIDIMRRSCKIVDELIVGVLSNKAKIPLFSVEERVKMLKEVTKDLDNIRIYNKKQLDKYVCRHIFDNIFYHIKVVAYNSFQLFHHLLPLYFSACRKNIFAYLPPSFINSRCVPCSAI